MTAKLQNRKKNDFLTRRITGVQPFRDYQQLKATFDTFAAAFADYLQSGSIPQST